MMKPRLIFEMTIQLKLDSFAVPYYFSRVNGLGQTLIQLMDWVRPSYNRLAKEGTAQEFNLSNLQQFTDMLSLHTTLSMILITTMQCY